MKLSSALIVACSWSIVTICPAEDDVSTDAAAPLLLTMEATTQAPISVATEAPTVTAFPGQAVGANSSLGDDKCIANMPSMPTKFFAKRIFNTFYNTISFTDISGNEFGYVKNWFIDWKNPFGFPGATFYYNTKGKSAHVGLWHMNPTPGANGYASNDTGFQQNTTGPAALDDRELAYMTGSHVKAKNAPGFLGDPFAGFMTVSDCHGNQKFEARNNNINVYKAADEAQFQTKRDDAANTLIISDYTKPIPKELVTMRMKSPCWPFAPFCQQMGMANWFMYGDQWEGDILVPEKNVTENVPNLGLEETNGVATDMRFLTLYSVYQFSNTRWSPLMLIVVRTVTFLIFAFFFWCCCINSVFHKDADKFVQKTGEETERLMSTVEAESGMKAKPKGMFACCGRRTDGNQESRTVVAVAKPGGPGGHH